LRIETTAIFVKKTIDAIATLPADGTDFYSIFPKIALRPA
jgi:hypothetical protein